LNLPNEIIVETLKWSSTPLEFPNNHLIKKTMGNLYYEIEIEGEPEQIWPWLQQFGYHRGGWYIDTWWDEFEQKYFWPNVVPEDARGTYIPPAKKIIPEYQNLQIGDTIPDGPPDTAYYEVVALEPNRLLQLYATTHLNYMAPQFVYRTRYAPSGAFCWAFIIKPLGKNRSRLISWWRVEVYPKLWFTILKPFLIFVDRAHQKEILKGIKKRVETANR
jgi:hypothetical protein